MAKTKVDNQTVERTAKEPQPSTKPAKKGPDKGGFYWGTGRRKSSVARVRIKLGDGKLLINKKSSMITSLENKIEKQFWPP